MKRYLLIIPVIFLLSSCIKVENASLCTNPPAKPVVTQQTFFVPLGGTFQTSVVSPSSSLKYEWVSPGGTIDSGASIHHYNITSSDYGTWLLFAFKGAECQSDTTKLTINYVNGPCGVGKDTFAIQGAAYPLSFSSFTTNYYGNYQLSFRSPYVSANISFPSQPVVNGQYEVLNNYGQLPSGYCSVDFTSGYYYSGYSGSVQVVVNGSSITATFCNMYFTYDGGTTTANACLSNN